MTLPATAITTDEIAANPRFARFASIALNAYWIWQHPEVKPHGLTFGLEVDAGGRYDLESLERQAARTNDSQIHMCLIGAAMLGKQHKDAVRADAAREYGIDSSEVEDIILGFDHGGDDGNPPRSRSGDTAAMEFGAAVRSALWGRSVPKYVAARGDSAQVTALRLADASRP